MLSALLAAVLLLQAGVTAPGNWQSEGLKALDEKRYQAAADIFSKAVASDPKDYAAHFHLALADSLLNRDTDAIREYREVLALKPGLYQAELNLGIVLLRQKQAAEAVKLLSRAAETKPADFRPRYYEGEALLANGQFKEAADAFTKALALDGKSAPAEAGLARALARDNRLDDAAGHFRKAAELDPAYKDGLLELAELFERDHKPEQATQIYIQFPENAAAQERAGQLLLDAGKVDDAVPHLEAAIRISPTTANRMMLVSAYLKTKQSSKAFEMLAQALHAEPKSYDLRMLAGRMLRDERKFPEASGQFFAATQIKPDSAEAWSELAGVCIMNEKYPEALAALEHVKALGAEKPGHFYFRAIVLDKLHQLEPAVDNYRQFLLLSKGQRPDEEFKARQRVRILERELSKK
jgi:tetratricopeptide (TPR) repeat protein